MQNARRMFVQLRAYLSFHSKKTFPFESQKQQQQSIPFGNVPAFHRALVHTSDSHLSPHGDLLGVELCWNEY